MAKAPEDLTLEDVKQLLDAPAWVQENREFVGGNHWQDGTQWIGPTLPKSSDLAGPYKSEIERGFTSSNKIGAGCERHVMGVLGREPVRTFAPREPGVEPETVKGLADQADTLHQRWWERNKVHEGLQERATVALYAERAPLYAVVPPGFLKDGTLPAKKLDEYVDLIRLRYPRPEDCGIYRDPDTLQEIGIYRYRVDGEDRCDLTWVDADGMTVLRQLPEAPGTEPVRYDFGGRLPIFELERRPLFVTEQARQNQRALNLALSTIPRNVITAGFRTRVLIDIALPGKETRDPTTGEVTFTADPVPMGPNTLNAFHSDEKYDPEGRFSGYASGKVHTEEPVSPQAARDAVEEHTWQILDEFDQQHVAMSGDATTSAKSRITAKSGYVASLLRTQPSAQSAVEWLMEFPLAAAEGFAAGEGNKADHKYTGPLRATAKCKLDAGPVDPEEAREIRERWAAGLMSTETALALLGTDEVPEEMARIKEQRKAQTATEIFRAIKEGVDAGLSIYASAIVLGYDEETATKMQRGDIPDGLDQ